jgi:acyl carrier protein
VDATSWTFPSGVSQSRVPIGRPIANTRVYILDAYRKPVPIGIAGEIYIGGIGVARGYLNRPELTAERFLKDPFTEEAGARMYRTGDSGRWLADQTIEFLGRTDDQVKIRGYRIELGEIESVLRQHPYVRQAAVSAREDAAGAKRLIAYVVPEKEHEVFARELRAYLQLKLPEYMIPSALVALSELPLTPNGKVDKRALPRPDREQWKQESACDPPRTPIEEALANIWAELLSRECVGVHDNFFELGGNSLLATQVVSRIRRRFQIELPLRRIFESPTIASLVAIVEKAGRVRTQVAAQGIGSITRASLVPEANHSRPRERHQPSKA